ncbi:MAG: hypothetical protein ETSY1_37705 [Candidatus Entotheonella factor]|uniref:Uncharacterized protein n=1 Tax=Entotheonella factor TaxID=1429438 RepID=W4L8Z0_ENTF1|nr:MAG: hypothetical protein ETSY1_37705 [Candidatus Entotheonella factor]
MTLHYLRILSRLSSFAIENGANPENWAKQVFEDFTEEGQALNIVPLPDEPDGSIVGLYGKKIFGKACEDQHREDTLFLFRIESAERASSFATPVRHELTIRPIFITNDNDVEGVPIRSLLQSVGALTSQIGPVELIRPAPELVAYLRDLEHDVIWRYRPIRSSGVLEDSHASLDKLISLQKRFELLNRSTITGRDKFILTGQSRPKTIGLGELQKLGSQLLNMTLLNRLAINANDPSAVAALLAELPSIPGADTLCWTLWLTWLSEQSPDTVKRELHITETELAETIGQLDDSFQAYLVETIRLVGQRHHDSSMITVADDASDAESPCDIVVQWSSSLVFREPEPQNDVEQADLTDARPPEPSSANVESVEAPQSATPHIMSTSVEPLAIPSQPIPTTGAHQSDLSPTLRQVLTPWIIGQRLPVSDILNSLEQPVQNARQQLEYLREVLGYQHHDRMKLSDLLEAFTQLRESVDHALHMVPSQQEVRDAVEEAGSLISQLTTELTELGQPDFDQSVSLSALRETVESTELLQVARALPNWLVGEATDASQKTLKLINRVLREDEFRKQLTDIAVRLYPLGSHLETLLSSLLPPSSGDDPVEYLAAWASQTENVLDDLREFAVPIAKWAQRAIALGVEPRVSLAMGKRLESLASQVPQEFFEHLITLLHDIQDSDAGLAILKRAEHTVAALEGGLGSKAQDLSLELWLHAYSRQPSDREEQDSDNMASQLSIIHNFVDSQGRRVPATYVPAEGHDEPYGYIMLPLLIQSDAPCSENLSLDIHLKTNQRHAWPSNWPKPEPERLELREKDWREVEGRFQYAFTATIPLRSPGEGRDRTVQIAFEGFNDKTRKQHFSSTLEWNQFDTYTAPLELEWSDKVESDYVKEHPIGAQVQADHLLNRLEQGDSIAAIAPRRFGKSTLVAYLEREAEKRQLLVIRIVCTSYELGDRPSMWKYIHQEFVKRLTVGLPITEYPDLPSPEAFQTVRTAAALQTYRCIILLFDEAQLLWV